MEPHIAVQLARFHATQSDFIRRSLAGREPFHSFDIADVNDPRDYDAEIKDAEVMKESV